MRPFFTLAFYFLAIGGVYAQSNKYALIIQNLKFDDASKNIDNQKDNVQVVKRLLLRHNFEDKKIWLRENLPADSVRKTILAFKKILPKGAICVVFLGSHGDQVIDLSGDEILMQLPENREKNPDRLDEYFICKDTPKIISEKDLKKRKNRIGHYLDEAILDDELSYWNEEIMKQIGPQGEYLMLADHCNSSGIMRGASMSEIQVEIESMDNNSSTNAQKQPSWPTFVTFAATTTKIKQPENPNTQVSHFVAAMVKAFDFYSSQIPTYEQLFEALRENLDKNKYHKAGGKPSIFFQNPADAKKLVFRKQWKTEEYPLISKVIRYINNFIIPKEFRTDTGTKIFTVEVSNPESYSIGLEVSIFLNNEKIMDAEVVNIERNNISLNSNKNFNFIENGSYYIRQNYRHYKALQMLDKITHKNELHKVLTILQDSQINIKETVCLNEYDIKNNQKVPKNKPCQSLNAVKDVSLDDKVTLFFDTTGLDKNLFYTYLDVNTKKVGHCFEDSNSNILGFFSLKTQNPMDEKNKLRVKFSLPKGQSSLWIVISSVPIDENQIQLLLGDTWLPEQKYALWNVIKHIKGFKFIGYDLK